MSQSWVGTRAPAERVAQGDLREDAVSRAAGRLSGSSYPALRAVSCRLDGQRLVLRGKVASFYLKQLAQELVRTAAGNRFVVNELEVIASSKP